MYLDHATGIVIGAECRHRRRGHHPSERQHRAPWRPARCARLRIGRGVFIGSGATIPGDISVGDFAKIGAGTVVTGDVPAGCTAIGNPARLTNCCEPRFSCLTPAVSATSSSVPARKTRPP